MGKSMSEVENVNFSLNLGIPVEVCGVIGLRSQPWQNLRDVDIPYDAQV